MLNAYLVSPKSAASDPVDAWSHQFGWLAEICGSNWLALLGLRSFGCIWALWGTDDMNRTCVASTNPTYAASFSGSLGSQVTKAKDVTPPTFTPPFTLVAK